MAYRGRGRGRFGGGGGFSYARQEPFDLFPVCQSSLYFYFFGYLFFASNSFDIILQFKLSRFSLNYVISFLIYGF